jgi:putative permease
MTAISNWYKRISSDPQIVMLAVLLLAGFLIVIYFGEMLAPVLAGLVIAYLLDGLILLMRRRGVPRMPAVWLVFLIFINIFLLLLFGFGPLLSQQLSQLVQELPNMIASGQKLLMQLPQRYPDFVTDDQVRELITTMRQEAAGLGQHILAFSLQSIPNLVTLVVYLVLLPLLVFFFLKDKQLLMNWFVGLMPRNRKLAAEVWEEVNDQLSNYVRGKFWEIVIVGTVSFAVFQVLGLSYAMLLGLLVGLSVIIPYIGAAVVTFPVAIIALFQWGLTNDFWYLIAAYTVIQALDGNVLVPLLFSEAVNLHPIAIIVAVLLFGGIWGFWGVFFAIPLATLVKAVLSAWPDTQHSEAASTAG